MNVNDAMPGSVGWAMWRACENEGVNRANASLSEGVYHEIRLAASDPHDPVTEAISPDIALDEETERP